MSQLSDSELQLCLKVAFNSNFRTEVSTEAYRRMNLSTLQIPSDIFDTYYRIEEPEQRTDAMICDCAAAGNFNIIKIMIILAVNKHVFINILKSLRCRYINSIDYPKLNYLIDFTLQISSSSSLYEIACKNLSVNNLNAYIMSAKLQLEDVFMYFIYYHIFVTDNLDNLKTILTAYRPNVSYITAYIQYIIKYAENPSIEDILQLLNQNEHIVSN